MVFGPGGPFRVFGVFGILLVGGSGVSNFLVKRWWKMRDLSQCGLRICCFPGCSFCGFCLMFGFVHVVFR